MQKISTMRTSGKNIFEGQLTITSCPSAVNEGSRGRKS